MQTTQYRLYYSSTVVCCVETLVQPFVCSTKPFTSGSCVQYYAYDIAVLEKKKSPGASVFSAYDTIGAGKWLLADPLFVDSNRVRKHLRRNVFSTPAKRVDANV